MTKDQQIVAFLRWVMDEIEFPESTTKTLTGILQFAEFIADGTLVWDAARECLVKQATGETVKPTLH